MLWLVGVELKFYVFKQVFLILCQISSMTCGPNHSVNRSNFRRCHMRSDAVGMFQGRFPSRQLPLKEHPHIWQPIKISFQKLQLISLVDGGERTGKCSFACFVLCVIQLPTLDHLLLSLFWYVAAWAFHNCSHTSSAGTTCRSHQNCGFGIKSSPLWALSVFSLWIGDVNGSRFEY